jgi:RNA polymerase sigma-70 factor (ECF subfamily)
LEPELHVNPGLEPDQAFKVNAEQEEVRDALQKLTPDQRQVIVLKYLQGWRNREIAKSMQKPVGAIKALQHRGIVALRRHLIDSEEV